MLEYIISKFHEISQTASEQYGVNPMVFVIIYLGSVPIFYYSLYRVLRALGKKLVNEIMLWGSVFLCANIAPFLYVIVFGRNIPWWVYGIIALLIGQAVWSLIMRLRKKPASDPNTMPE